MTTILSKSAQALLETLSDEERAEAEETGERIAAVGRAVMMTMAINGIEGGHEQMGVLLMIVGNLLGRAPPEARDTVWANFSQGVQAIIETCDLNQAGTMQ